MIRLKFLPSFFEYTGLDAVQIKIKSPKATSGFVLRKCECGRKVRINRFIRTSDNYFNEPCCWILFAGVCPGVLQKKCNRSLWDLYSVQQEEIQ